MGETKKFGDDLSIVELESELALELPARDLMSLVNISIGNIGVVNAINLSGAMNVLSGGSSAVSAAMQQVSLGQLF
jgi:UDP-N-acetylmuramyl pentapeptide phosphotransferase/UDP-N-acetylglucosamine-1-phosphate transferase